MAAFHFLNTVPGNSIGHEHGVVKKWTSNYRQKR